MSPNTNDQGPAPLLFESPSIDPELEENVVNTIRMLALDAVQAANSGHAGLPMGMAGAALTLWRRHLRYNPANPDWHNRDRFILSAGHGSMLLYALLHLTGYELPLQELKNFRQWGSMTPGHPEYGHAPGVETTTGPLGQGFANGIGMAIAEQWLAANFNRPGFDVVSHHIYAIVSDGDLMEGVAQEAASLAGHLRLGKLIYLYDDNRVTIDGYTDLAFTEDQYQRFQAYGWHVQKVDGMDSAAVDAAIDAAKQDPRPSIIGCTTVIGFGAPKQGEPDMHSDALPAEEVAQTKANLEWPQEPTFFLPEEVRDFCLQAVERGNRLESDDTTLWDAYAAAHPDLAAQLSAMLQGGLPDGWEDALPAFDGGGSAATRNASGDTLNALAPVIPNLIGGSADLAPSNKTIISGSPDFQPDSYNGRNFRFGVREHGMGAILNGMALHGGVIPYGGTFLVFSDYMRASVRLAALMGVPAIFIFTHDSIGVGEDGPTHQPVEQVAALRAIPNLTVIRPADANEVAQAWKTALTNKSGPTALIFSRQNLPVYDRTAAGVAAAEGAAQGGYVFFKSNGSAGDATELALISSGSELEIAYEAAQRLAQNGAAVRVVSLPSWELFTAQTPAYQQEVLPPSALKLSIEAGVTQGWERWVGNDPARGAAIGLNRFGASAPQPDVYANLGLTVEATVSAAQTLLEA
ncbi:MAG: transketolase [Caldilineaceae bacterium]|nr:transketolase [Caldilineaceae bacterium]